MNNYFIKNGYRCNLTNSGNAIPYLDDSHTASLYQVKVYVFAKRLIKKYKLKNVLDIGCGFGVKLNKIIFPVCDNIVGIDTEHAIDFCKQEYNFGRWFEDDIENSILKLNEKFDLVISSDVIEHLVDPDNLLYYIRKYSHNKTHIIISSPERDLVNGKNSYGPPLNRTHVREWNKTEFCNYIRRRNLTIIKHFLIGESGLNLYETIRKIVLLEPLKKIQVVHCRIPN